MGMKYGFICPKCKKEKIIEMPISQYTNKGHFCVCGEEMVRNPQDFCTNSPRSVEGFFGKSN